MKQVFLHLGAHKTGTTYIQGCLRESQDFFDKRKSMLVVHRDDTDKHMVDDLMQWRKSKSPRKAPKSLVDYFQNIALDEHDTCLVSYEGFLGTMDIGQSGTIYPHMQKSLDAIKDGFENQEIKIAFAVRGYSDYIESVYKWMVKRGLRNSRKTFRAYLEGVNVQEISWVPVVNKLRKTFGEENVLVWSQERFRKDPERGNLEMMRFFYGDNVSPKDIISDVPDANVALNYKALNTIHLIRRAISKSEFLSKEDKNILNKNIPRRIGSVFREIDDREKPVLLKQKLREALQERYIQDCRSLGIKV